MARDSAASLSGQASSVNLLRLRKRPEREWAPMLGTLTNSELAAILQAHGGGTEPGTKGTLHLSKQSLLTMLTVYSAPRLQICCAALSCDGECHWSMWWGAED